MKKLICCLFALCIGFIPMSVSAHEDSFVYNGKPCIVAGASQYYDLDGIMLDGPPTDVGHYFAHVDEDYVEFEIVQAKLNCVVTNSELYYGDSIPEFEYVLYDSNHNVVNDFVPLSIQLDTDDHFFAPSNPNYEITFSPVGVTYKKKDITISSPDLEYVYNGKDIIIRYDNCLNDLEVSPIVLKDAGEYVVRFPVKNKSNLYNVVSKSFKVRVLPQEIVLSPSYKSKVIGNQDPVFEENENYKITRIAGEKVGYYKYLVTSKNKNYKYRIDENCKFEIKEKKITSVPTGIDNVSWTYFISLIGSAFVIGKMLKKV